MRHVIVSRFSVPRLEPETAACHTDERWLAERLALLRRWFAPSVGRLGVPTILLCSSASAAWVADRTADLEWIRVEEQDDWHAGRGADADTVVTRLDTDDAIHEGWFADLDAAPPGFGIYGSRRFLRLDLAGRRLYDYRRREPSPLAAFTAGRNPYRRDHAELGSDRGAWFFDAAYLLQVVHGGNVKNRRPGWLRFHRRVPLDRLTPFGVGLEPV